MNASRFAVAYVPVSQHNGLASWPRHDATVAASASADETPLDDRGSNAVAASPIAHQPSPATAAARCDRADRGRDALSITFSRSVKNVAWRSPSTLVSNVQPVAAGVITVSRFPQGLSASTRIP